MKTIGAYEAKTHLSRLLDEVRSGESFVITKHGQEVARLVPPSPQRDVKAAIRTLKELRQGLTTGGIPLRELIEEGRR